MKRRTFLERLTALAVLPHLGFIQTRKDHASILFDAPVVKSASFEESLYAPEKGGLIAGEPLKEGMFICMGTDGKAYPMQIRGC